MGKVVIFSAPSGSGKTTIVRELLKRFPQFEFSVSATSRAPRGCERHGCDYHFMTHEEFMQAVAENRFVDCVRGFGQQKLHHRRFDPLRQARCGAGPFRHLEAVHFGRQFGGPLVGALGRDDEHRFVAQSLLHDIFGQGDMAFVYGVERPEIEHYALHDRPVMNSSMMRVVSAMASSSESFTTM